MSNDQMSDDVRELESMLLAELPKLVRDARAPAGLPEQVRARVRGRRARRQSAVGLCIIAVLAVAAVVFPGQRAAPRPALRPRTITVAEVIQRARAAQASLAHLISVTTDRAGVTYLDASHQRTRWVSAQRTAGGHPLMATADSITGTTWTATQVDYKDHAYTTMLGGAKGITIGATWPYGSASDPAAAYAGALRHGQIKLIGFRRLDGKSTILIELVPQRSPAQSKPFRGAHRPPPPGGGGPIVNSCPYINTPADVIRVWLDASSYLAVQYSDTPPNIVGGQPTTRPGQQQTCAKVEGWGTPLYTTVRWLPPTPENKALAILVPPAGFSRVSEQQMAVYLGPYS